MLFIAFLSVFFKFVWETVFPMQREIVKNITKLLLCLFCGGNFFPGWIKTVSKPVFSWPASFLDGSRVPQQFLVAPFRHFYRAGNIVPHWNGWACDQQGGGHGGAGLADHIRLQHVSGSV